MGKPSMPTYLSAAETLEKKTGSGMKLIGWSLLRMLLIAPPILLVTPREAHRRVWIGAAMSTTLISVLAMLRIFNAGQTGLAGTRHRRTKRLRA